MTRGLTQTTAKSRSSDTFTVIPIPKQVNDVRQQFTSFEHNNVMDDKATALILDRLKISGGEIRSNRFLIIGVVMS